MPETNAFLELLCRKGLIDDSLAQEIAAAVAATGQDPASLLEARGVLTPWLTTRLRAELGPPPPEIPGFRLTGRLGQGGMGVVYRAVQLSVGREVAIKVLAGERARDTRFAERFLREARVAAGVNHPHVVTVYDAGRAGETLYLALELVSGGDAERLARANGGRLPQRRAAEIVRDAARGLGALARAGLVHRDLKPANLFITSEGAAKVADLGLARGIGGDDRLTTDGGVLGTPAFMSPEQASGTAELDVRSDIYALGATLYALLTGQAPFRGKTPFGISAQVIAGPFPDPRACDAAIPEALAALILRATARDRELRPGSAQELEQALDALIPRLAQPSTLTPNPAALAETNLPPTAPTVLADQAATAPTIVVPSPQQRRGLLPVVAILALALVIGGVLLGRQLAAPPGSAPAPALVPAPAPPDPTPPPAWASTGGSDQYGRWAELTVYGIHQRFRRIPAGTFRMGSPPSEMGRREDEIQHQVTLTRAFWMADCETTQELWYAVNNANRSRFNKNPLNPVDNVYHEGAIEFCAKLNILIKGLGARLATEAEWEYACRAGTTTATPLDLPLMAWVNRPFEGNTTRPVRQGQANAWGLYDMLGNAAEWVQDTYAPYPEGAVTDPVATGGKWPVYRGGSFCSVLADCRSAARQQDEEHRYLALGTVRLVIPDAGP